MKIRLQTFIHRLRTIFVYHLHAREVIHPKAKPDAALGIALYNALGVKKFCGLTQKNPTLPFCFSFDWMLIPHLLMALILNESIAMTFNAPQWTELKLKGDHGLKSI